MQQIGIDEFMALAAHNLVIDVRSPGEYDQAHIPGAASLPLFTDEERKVVGTLYKQQSRQDAIKSGLDFFGKRMRQMVEQAEDMLKNGRAGQHTNTVMIHCWRGGMRSAGVAWLLDLYGFKVYTLKGGYKAFRSWCLRQFGQPCPFIVLGGNTGSGKTEILKELAAKGHAVIDLEAIANHKGSAFGALGENTQPSQEMFENKLALALHKVSSVDKATQIWVEDESRRIGLVNIPDALWKTMRLSPVHFIQIPFEERLDYLVKGYGRFEIVDLLNPVMRIKKRLGGLNTKNAVNYLIENNVKECFRILLHYYDKFYEADLHQRLLVNKDITMIDCEKVDAKVNMDRLTKSL